MIPMFLEGQKAPRYMTVFWKRSSLKRGWLGGLFVGGGAKLAKDIAYLFLKSISEVYRSSAPSNSRMWFMSAVRTTKTFFNGEASRVKQTSALKADLGSVLDYFLEGLVETVAHNAENALTAATG